MKFIVNYILFVFFIYADNGTCFAQNSSILLNSNKLSQCIGYKQLNKDYLISVISENDNGNFDIVVNKHNENNKIIWSKKFDLNNNSNDKVADFMIDRDENIVLIGNFDRYNAYILKLSGADGSIIFSKFMKNANGNTLSNFRRIYQLKNNNSEDYIVLGTVNYPDYHVISRFAKSGAVVWSKEYNISGGNELLYCLSEASNGDIIIGGAFGDGSIFDQGIVKLNASNGNMIKILTYNLNYRSYFNSGFDDVCSIDGTDYLAFSTVINDGVADPTRHGVTLFNTKTDSIVRYQIYSFGNTSRSSSIKYIKNKNKLVIGAYVKDNFNINMIFNVIDYSDFTKINTFQFKDIVQNRDASGVAHLDVGINNEILVAGYVSSNSNLSVGKAFISKYDLDNFNCLNTINSQLVSTTLPAPEIPTYTFSQNYSLNNFSPSFSNYFYTESILCEDNCTPTKKLFNISTPKAKDSICYGKVYNLNIAINNNVQGYAVMLHLFKKVGGAWVYADSVSGTANGQFNVSYANANSHYRVIGMQKCSFNDTLYFELFKYQLANNAIDTTLFSCYNEALVLNSSFTYNGNSTIALTWSDSATNAPLGSGVNITYNAVKNATIFLSANAYCAAPAMARLYILAAPKVIDSTIVDIRAGCSPFSPHFIHPTTIGPAANFSPFIWQWVLKNNDIYSTSALAGVVIADYIHPFTTGGKYPLQVDMVLPNERECVSYYDTITVWQRAKAAFTFSPAIVDINDKEVQFINQSQYANAYYWCVSDTSVYSLFSPKHSLKRAGIYNIKLVAFGEQGCNDTTIQTLVVNDAYNIMIPNGFSPNGDGSNDTWTPYFAGAENVEMQIFNRWGELLYMANGPYCTWNGEYKLGNCEQGVYMYILKVKSSKLQWYQYKGTLSLLR